MMRCNVKEKNFSLNIFLKAVMTVAMPIALQNLLGTTASMVDTIMIGTQGELAVAAVGICSQISSLFFACYFGFASGALLFFARKGKVLPGALFPGKICTTVVFASLILLVFFPNMPMSCVILLTWMDLTFLLFSFGSYLWAYLGSRDYLTDL